MLACALALFAVQTAKSQTLNVFAATRFHDALTEIAKRFEERHPGVSVSLNFGGVSELSGNVAHAVLCDVLVGSDDDTVAVDPSTRRVFAFDRLVVVCRRRGGVASFRDLPTAKSIVLERVQDPEGGFERSALEKAAAVYGASWLDSVEAEAVVGEAGDFGALREIAAGHADAGIIFGSDARSGPAKVRLVSIPAQFQTRISYPIAMTRDAANPGIAKAFIRAVVSPAMRKILRSKGFLVPR